MSSMILTLSYLVHDKRFISTLQKYPPPFINFEWRTAHVFCTTDYY